MRGTAAWGPLIRQLRSAAGLTQSQLARAAGIGLDSLRSYEGGRRRPARAVIDALTSALELGPAEERQLLLACGEEVAASPLLRAIGDFRAEFAVMAEEVAAYEWVSLIINERHEIRAWNGLANAVAEMDLGVDLPTLFERNILWMASLPHFEARLTNWEELIGSLIGVLKRENVRVEEPGGIPPYLQVLIDRVGIERPHALQRFFTTWLVSPEFVEGVRQTHPIRWRLGDGTELSFCGIYRDWSLFDGTFAFDWMAADRETSSWVAEQFSGTGPRGWANHLNEFIAQDLPGMLQEARLDVKMSRRVLAERAGISEDSVYKYETGERHPRRETLLAIARALTLDGLRINALTRTAGYDEEPSDFARVLAGYEGAGIFQGREAMTGRTRAQLHAELQALAHPCFLVNARCEVEGANRAGDAITRYSSRPAPAGREGPHLLQFFMSPFFRERLLNWKEVARAIVPQSLRPLVLGYRDEKRPGYLADVIGMLRREDPRALRDLDGAWAQHPSGPTPRRIITPLEWVGDDGRLMKFQCFINSWNAFDPCWAVDWHPMNDAAWDATEAAR
ncbi:MAG: helix-turn-helix domain-containing protein [Dehalococcoidia bacterium]|nr:helix-turn-helix domain-containing protein [Dehalococcoidia bacterium]